MKFVRKAVTLPLSKKRMVAEAAYELLRAWYLVRFREFRQYEPMLGAPEAGEHVDIGNHPPDRVRHIRWAVKVVCNRSGSHFTCLMQAMAGKAMLNRRGITNALVLGAKLAPETDEAMKAHAWLKTGDVILLGSEEMHGYAPVTSYLGP